MKLESDPEPEKLSEHGAWALMVVIISTFPTCKKVCYKLVKYIADIRMFTSPVSKLTSQCVSRLVSV